MKNLIFLLFFITTLTVNAQAYSGKYDSKFQVGANLQKNASGLNLSHDYGIGENISIGVSGTYLLGVNEEIEADFSDRLDIKARFNANLSSVLNIDPNFDAYPGLSLGLKNLGAHAGARFFFSEGFGLFSEIGFPIATYDDELTEAEKLHNRFYINLGAVFNLQ